MKKILHLQTIGYTEGLGYQENILLKYHRKLGYEVTNITSTAFFNEKTGKFENAKPCIYKNGYGVKVVRLPYPFSFCWRILQKLGIIKGISKAIELERPDIIFIHDPQQLSNLFVLKYVQKNHNIKLYVDNHADYLNSARNWVSKLVHKTLWRSVANIMEPYTNKFYGVLPARCDFLHEMYKIPKDKIELLVLGADDDMISLDPQKRECIRKCLREKYGLLQDDFVIITGGKIDLFKKQTLLLMSAVKKLNNPIIKLLIFGIVSDELKDTFKRMVDNQTIKYIGWVDSTFIYDLFVASDLAFFPCRHSVLWEQAVGTGIPAVFKYWKGINHVDLGGNCKFIYNCSEEEIYKVLNEIILNKDNFENMKRIALEKGPNQFLFSEIAKQSIEHRG